MDPYRLYLDTEFNGYRGELISLAMVDGRGREFYEAVVPWAPIDPWVAQHVMPVLRKSPVAMADFQERLQEFIHGSPGGRTIEIVADWPDDIKYFCAAMVTGPGRAIDYGRDLHFAVFNLTDFNSAKESKLPHNALADAKALCRYCTDEKYLLNWTIHLPQGEAT